MNQILYFVKKLHSYAGKILYINLIGMLVMSLLEGIGILFLIPMINMSGMVNLNEEGTPLTIFALFDRIPNSLGILLILSIYVFLRLVKRYYSVKLRYVIRTFNMGFSDICEMKPMKHYYMRTGTFLLKIENPIS